MKQKVIKLNKAEIQSGLSRVKSAEGLIVQLPEDHDRRNTWLLNYGIGAEADYLRRNHSFPPIWDVETQSLSLITEELTLLGKISLAQDVFSKSNLTNQEATHVILTQKTADLVSGELKKNSGGKDLIVSYGSDLFNMRVIIDEDVHGLEFLVV